MGRPSLATMGVPIHAFKKTMISPGLNSLNPSEFSHIFKVQSDYNISELMNREPPTKLYLTETR